MMMLKAILFGGFLFATVCASGSGTTIPKVATLEVHPNFEYGLVHKEFRVHYSGTGIEGATDVYIKIYKNGETTERHSFSVKEDVNTPKAYYFGLTDADEGKYEVDVCVGSKCSGRNPALTNIPSDTEKGKITCVRGSVNKETSEWEDAQENAHFSFDIIKAGDWLDQNIVTKIESELTAASGGKKVQIDWTKLSISSNPSYKDKKLYAAVMYDVAHYRELFMQKGVEGENDNRSIYTHEFCDRKYLLSSHLHLMDKATKEVKYRYKKTLYMSPGGKQYFIYSNTGEAEKRRKVHVEMTFNDVDIAPATYQALISFCATEKDVVDSTVCSDPVIKDEFTVSV